MDKAGVPRNLNRLQAIRHAPKEAHKDRKQGRGRNGQSCKIRSGSTQPVSEMKQCAMQGAVVSVLASDMAMNRAFAGSGSGRDRMHAHACRAKTNGK